MQRLSHGFPIDQFSYNYQQNSNKLLRVNDSIVYTFSGMDFVNKPDASAFYEYDSNGKLSSDNGVSRYTTVTYYSTGMPKKVVVQDKGEIHYIYDAMGTKLAQIPIHENSFSLRRDYLGALELVNGQPEFMHTAEGRALETQEGNYRYEYHLNDHLGNMRLAFSDRNQDGEINHQNKVLQVRDYYPFGQPHVPLGLQIGLKDKYLFNSKELQEDFGLYQYDFGARTYDPQLARWFSVDPLAHKIPGWSPYATSFNNPILYFDPDGAFPYTFHVRSFHPDATFGGGFMGDNRSYSNNPSSSARIAQQFTFDPSTGQSSNRGFANNFSMYAAGFVTSKGAWGIGKETPGETHFDVSGGNGSYDISTGYEGANSLTPDLFSPMIDVHSNFSVTENLEKGILSINASITGDNFPNAEAFVVDQSGKNSVFIGVSSLSGGVLTSLWGDNYRDMINANFNIGIDDKGNFTGVTVGDQSFSVDEWNAQFQSTGNE